MIDDAARQRARERAADGVAPRELVVILPYGWPAKAACGTDIDPAERQRRYRARRRSREMQVQS